MDITGHEVLQLSMYELEISAFGQTGGDVDAKDSRPSRDGSAPVDRDDRRRGRSRDR